MIEMLRKGLHDLERRFVAWSRETDLRRRAGLLGTWPWQTKPNTRYVALDSCCTEEAARQIARAAIAESGAEFAVVDYQDVHGEQRTLVESA